MKKNNKGFTIIEVVLVLAIAGLIFLIVFLALPALQKNQRDTQRRSDMGRVIAAMQSYQSNTNGGTPFTFTAGGAWSATAAGFATYLDTFTDPSGAAYAWQAAAPTGVGQIQVIRANACPTTTAVAAGTKTIVNTFLEQGSATYCVSN